MRKKWRSGRRSARSIPTLAIMTFFAIYVDAQQQTLEVKTQENNYVLIEFGDYGWNNQREMLTVGVIAARAMGRHLLLPEKFNKNKHNNIPVPVDQLIDLDLLSRYIPVKVSSKLYASTFKSKQTKYFNLKLNQCYNISAKSLRTVSEYYRGMNIRLSSPKWAYPDFVFPHLAPNAFNYIHFPPKYDQCADTILQELRTYKNCSIISTAHMRVGDRHPHPLIDCSRFNFSENRRSPNRNCNVPMYRVFQVLPQIHPASDCIYMASNDLRHHLVEQFLDKMKSMNNTSVIHFDQIQSSCKKNDLDISALEQSICSRAPGYFIGTWESSWAPPVIHARLKNHDTLFDDDLLFRLYSRKLYDLYASRGKIYSCKPVIDQSSGMLTWKQERKLS